MIIIDLYEDGKSFKLDMSGHAGSAPKGEDLVCAGASMLAYTLIGRLEDLGIKISYHLEDGKLTLFNKDPRGMEPMMTVLSGFRLLQLEYPEYVQLNIF